jgi:hypothetical protein
MNIKTPESLVITESMARGHRRYLQLKVNEKLDQRIGKGGPQKFGPCVREHWQRLRLIHGVEYTKKLSVGKRDARFLFVDSVELKNHYVVMELELKRIRGTVGRVYRQYFFVFTNHFVERYIQLKLDKEEDFIVSIAKDLINEFHDMFYVDSSSSTSLEPEAVWLKSGPFAFATKNLLILGSVPGQGDAIVKTVIHKTRLEEEKRALWLHLRRCKKHLKIGKEL